MADQLRIKLVRSIHGILPKHKATINGLGLRKINHTVTRENTPCIRGMVNQVNYLIEVEEI